MAEEPQPDSNPPNPTAAEQKQEAAALSNLGTHNNDDEEKHSAGDTAALGAALSNLSVNGGEKGAAKGGAGGDSKAAVEVKKVKIEAADVSYLVEELEVSKKKATELLQACLGDRLAAVKTYVLPAAAKA